MHESHIMAGALHMEDANTILDEASKLPSGPSPKTAQFTEKPCELVTYHAPQPVMTEYHHSKPVFLQNQLYGKIVYGADTWVCSNCHDAIHAWLYYLLGMWRKPTYMGRAARAEAERTFAWFMAEGGDRALQPALFEHDKE